LAHVATALTARADIAASMAWRSKMLRSISGIFSGCGATPSRTNFLNVPGLKRAAAITLRPRGGNDDEWEFFTSGTRDAMQRVNEGGHSRGLEPLNPRTLHPTAKGQSPQTRNPICIAKLLIVNAYACRILKPARNRSNAACAAAVSFILIRSFLRDAEKQQGREKARQLAPTGSLVSILVPRLHQVDHEPLAGPGGVGAHLVAVLNLGSIAGDQQVIG
jgi:hypothetical protein